MTRKKILFLITKATQGGAQKYVFDLATNVPPERFEPVVAFGEGGKLSSDLRERGVRTAHLPALQRDVAILPDLMSFFQILRALRHEKPDVLHLNSSKAAGVGALAARFAGVPRVIFTVHGWPFNEPRMWITRIAIYLLSWFTALLSHEVIVVSKEDERLARRLWGIARKLHYIPVGIAPLAQVEREEARYYLLNASGFAAHREKETRWKLFEKQKILLTIAELTKNKGLRYAIEAVAELRRRGREDFLYFLIGAGEMREELRLLIASLNLQDRVFLFGFVPDAATFLRGCDTFILPSLKEGLPYVLIEARNASLPIVATDVGGAREVLEGYEQSALVPAQNPVAIAEAVLKLESASPGDEESAGEDFTLASMVEKTIPLYEAD